MDDELRDLTNRLFATATAMLGERRFSVASRACFGVSRKRQNAVLPDKETRNQSNSRPCGITSGGGSQSRSGL